MPRQNRRRRDDVPLDAERVMGGVPRRQSYAGRDYLVRSLTGATSERSYLCPGCQQQIRPGTPHVVVWPADGALGVEDRRHWHSPCWSARDRRHAQGPR